MANGALRPPTSTQTCVEPRPGLWTPALQTQGQQSGQCPGLEPVPACTWWPLCMWGRRQHALPRDTQARHGDSPPGTQLQPPAEHIPLLPLGSPTLPTVSNPSQPYTGQQGQHSHALPHVSASHGSSSALCQPCGWALWLGVWAPAPTSILVRSLCREGGSAAQDLAVPKPMQDSCHHGQSAMPQTARAPMG